MTTMGDNRLSKKDLEMMVEEADSDHDGLIKWEGDNILLNVLHNFYDLFVFFFRFLYNYLY